MSAGWPWNRLGAALEAARIACVPRGQPGHAENAARFHAAWAAVWPPGFLQDVERCKAGDAAGLEAVLQFAEACPRFFCSGHVLQDCVHWMTRPPRTDRQTKRMAALVMEAVEGRLRLPFRYIPSLATAVDSVELRAALRRNADGVDEKVRARAIQVLDRLPGPPWDPERARLRKVENRLGAQLASARRRLARQRRG